METTTPTPKQQIVERLRNAQSVLITVSNSPALDEVISALALGKILDRLGKKATTVISSPLPSKLDALKIDKMVSKSIDKLRDFVIELDKDKADKLRYKAEDDVVKIFITPYKSEIKVSDFRFTQGEYNVDVVVTIGVQNRDELDSAIKENSRVLHHADVLDLSASSKKGGVGTLNWHEPEASSVAEMLVSLADALQSGLLDAETSQLLLSAIIVATDGFRNKSTTPKIMTLSAQLMANGANSQQSMAQFVDASKPAPTSPEKEATETLSIPHIDHKPKEPVPTPKEVKAASHERPGKREDKSSPLNIDPNLSFPPSGRVGTTRDQDKKARDAIDSMLADAREMNEQMKNEREQIARPASETPIMEHKEFRAAAPTVKNTSAIPQTPEPHLQTNPNVPTLTPQTPAKNPTAVNPAKNAPPTQPAEDQHEHNIEVARDAVVQAVEADKEANPELAEPISAPTTQIGNLTIDHNGQVRST